MFKFDILSNAADAALDILKIQDGIYEYKFSCKANGDEITVITHKDCINCFTVWNHSIDFDRQLRPEWFSSKCYSSILKGAPCQCLIGQDGNNVLTISASDCKNRMEIKTGIHEEESTVTCKVVFYVPKKDGETYETLLRFDTRNIPYYECIYSVSDWWTSLGYTRAYVPNAAKMPMYSSWYSFHQMLSHDAIIEQCILAKELGMDTIILDDGWQTEDVARGYAYCGDWECAFSKVGNMRELTDKIHAMGMKILIWYNIAFMGEHAKNCQELEGMYMGGKVRGRYTLDPRYPKVREYLIELFKKAVSDWNLDGLKIDFVDSFIRSEDDIITDGMDYPVLEDAVDELLGSVKRSLTEINPEIMIEFRQNYMGPAMRKHANIFRVADCPNDSLRNRLGAVNLRLTSGGYAVHSDMLMWNYSESAHIAAKQIINILFSVPQISVRIENLSESHYKMLKFYLSLWIKYQDLFINQKMIPLSPETNYSKVYSENNDTKMCVCYSDNTISIGDKEKTILVNGTSQTTFFTDCTKKCIYTVYSCTGDVVYKGKLKKGVSKIHVPVSAVVEFGMR